MRVNLLFISLLPAIIPHVTIAQEVNYKTFGKCSFAGKLNIPEEYTISPGQISKDGKAYILGLSSNTDDSIYYDIYSLSILNSAPPAAFHLPYNESYKELTQSSLTADGNIMVFVANNYNGWSGNELAISIKDEYGKFTDFRMLDEINDPLNSDSYPWITADGNSIYYTKNDKLFVSEKHKNSEKFTSALEVKFTGTVELPVVSAWLTNNEKKLYFISNNIIYFSTRKNRNNKFSLPKVFTNEFKNFEFISAVCFSPDLKDMYLYYAGDDEEILHYKISKN